MLAKINNMYNRTDAITSKKLMIQERILLKLFTKYSELNIFDIGSCEGENSIRYSRFFPNAKIYSFEPLPNNVNHIKNNISRYNCSNIQVEEVGLSDAIGTSTFYVSSGTPEEYANMNMDWNFGNKSSSLLQPGISNQIHPWLKFEDTVTIQTDTLDHFCKSRNVDHIDFIHIDVQGAELMVLKGGDSILSKVVAIWMEVEAIPLYRNQPLKNDVEQFMMTHNFIKVADTVDEVSGDQFWLNNNLVQLGGKN